MAKYLLLKHYRSASQPAPIACEPMDQWTPEEVSAHIQYMVDFAKRLEGTGEFVGENACGHCGRGRSGNRQYSRVVPAWRTVSDRSEC